MEASLLDVIPSPPPGRIPPSSPGRPGRSHLPLNLPPVPGPWTAPPALAPRHPAPHPPRCRRGSPGPTSPGPVCRPPESAWHPGWRWSGKFETGMWLGRQLSRYIHNYTSVVWTWSITNTVNVLWRSSYSLWHCNLQELNISEKSWIIKIQHMWGLPTFTPN